MGLLCGCPRSAAISDIPLVDCEENFGQIQKLIFMRVYSTGIVKNNLIDPQLLATWTPLLAATDGTKVVQTPYIHAPTIEAGAAKTYGGGNDTLGGVEIIVGREPSSFSANMLMVSQKTIQQLKDFQCENVGVFLVDEYGRIGLLVDNHYTPIKHYPIPVHGLFVGDKSFGGLDTPDMNTISFKFFPNSSDMFKIIVPTDFNALTDLATPSSGS